MEALEIPEYHSELRRLFELEQPELWSWFAEARRPSPADVAQAELEILKSSYRLDGDVHATLAGLAPVLAGRLGLEADVVLYQALGDASTADVGRNARVVMLGDRIHIVFAGDLLGLLDLHEQEAVLAHELAHVWLLRVDAGAFDVLDRLVHRLDAESDDSTLAETARRLRLHTEVFSDRLAIDLITVGPDLIAPGATHDAAALDAARSHAEATVVRALVKVHSGLHHVDAAAYLRQARQILESDSSTSEGWTHPELHVRIACLAARHTPGAADIAHHLIDGVDDLDRLDLLGQRRLQAVAARVLTGGAAVARTIPAAVTTEIDHHLASFANLDVAEATPLADDALDAASPSVRHLAAALLLDLAMLLRGAEADFSDLERLAAEARRIGVEREFDTLRTRAMSPTGGGAR